MGADPVEARSYKAALLSRIDKWAYTQNTCRDTFMLDVIFCILEPLLDGAMEWLMLQFCNLLTWSWHGLESFFAQMFF